MDSSNSEHNSLLTTQALIELTEANVQASEQSEEWAEQVDFLQNPVDERSCGPDAVAICDAMNLATALG